MKEEFGHSHSVKVDCVERRPFKLSGLDLPDFDVEEVVRGPRPKKPWFISGFSNREDRLSEDGQSLLEDSFESIRLGRYRTFRSARELFKELND